MRSISANPVKAVDFQLRMLGFTNRADWMIQSHGEREYTDGKIICRPDWVCSHIDGFNHIILEYKNYFPKRRGPSSYEQWQVAIYIAVLNAALAQSHNRQPKSYGVLLFADETRYAVEPTVEEFQRISDVSTELAVHYGRVVAGTTLARHLCDGPDFKNNPKARESGIQAHAMLSRTGRWMR